MEEKSEQRILVVDDEQAITDFVSFNLSKEGYQVDVAHNGNEAVDMANANDYDLVILDVMLPGIDGYEVCRRIRAKSNVPVLFLSARDTELDKVVGLELGGDDYLAKPFGIRELLARVHALLRRAPQEEDTGADGVRVLDVSGIHLDEAGHHATFEGKDIELTPREFELLVTLMRARCSDANSSCARHGTGNTSSRPRPSTRTSSACATSSQASGWIPTSSKPCAATAIVSSRTSTTKSRGTITRAPTTTCHFGTRGAGSNEPAPLAANAGKSTSDRRG